MKKFIRNQIVLSLLYAFIIFSPAHSKHEGILDSKSINLNFTDNGKVMHMKPMKLNCFRRHLRPINFEVDGEKVQLNFVRSNRKVFSPNIPIWLVKSNPQCTPNYTYELLKNKKDFFDGKFYVDNKNKAVVLVRIDPKTGKTLYDGIFGEGSARRAIRSLPQSSKFRSRREGKENVDHLTFNLPELDPSNFDGEIIIERNGINLSKLQKPLDVLYPKLLIVVDYDLFKLLGKNVAQTVRYVATFWNIVDQKYERLNSPKVQIVVTGIVIANDEKALNYIHRSRNGTDKGDMDQIIEDSRLYFSQSFNRDTNFKNYDAVMIMTGLEMNPVEGFFELKGLAAKLGSICSTDYNVAIVTDDAKYRNTIIGVHELGHLLNLSHDYADECDGISYLFGSAIQTSVMSSVSNGTEIFWSQCSQRLLKEFASLKVAECLATRNRT